MFDGYEIDYGGEVVKCDDVVGNLMVNVGVFMVLMIVMLVLLF